MGVQALSPTPASSRTVISRSSPVCHPNNMFQFGLLMLEQDPSYFRVQVGFSHSPPPISLLVNPHHQQRMTSPFLSRDIDMLRISWSVKNQLTSSKFSLEYPMDSLSGVTRMFPMHVSSPSCSRFWVNILFSIQKAGQRRKVLGVVLPFCGVRRNARRRIADHD